MCSAVNSSVLTAVCLGYYYRAACNADAGSNENSVCLSVRPSVHPSVRPSVRLSHAWIVTKRKKDLSRFLYHTKDNLA